MTGRILCNLSFLYNKKRHGRILFFHTYYLFLYSTEYTFFSIICVSCTYFPLKANCIHSIHACHLYLILRQEVLLVHLLRTLLLWIFSVFHHLKAHSHSHQSLCSSRLIIFQQIHHNVQVLLLR